MQKSASWHMFNPDLSISELVEQECLHEPDGRFPITLTCNWLGGNILLEIVRSDDKILAIYYFSEVTAEKWAKFLGFRFVDQNWQVIESLKGVHPYVVGKVVPRNQPKLLGESVERSFNLLQPDLVVTGDIAIPGYVCPTT